VPPFDLDYALAQILIEDADLVFSLVVETLIFNDGLLVSPQTEVSVGFELTIQRKDKIVEAFSKPLEFVEDSDGFLELALHQ